MKTLTQEQKQTKDNFLALISEAEKINNFSVDIIKNDIFVLSEKSHYESAKKIVDNFRKLNAQVITNSSSDKKTLKSYLDKQKYSKNSEIAFFNSLKSDVEKQNFIHCLNRISSISRNTTMYKKSVISNKILLSKETYTNNNFHFNENIENALLFQCKTFVQTIKDLSAINEDFKSKFAAILQ